MKAKVYYNWEDIHRSVDFISSILPKDYFIGITGIPRGGLIPAVLLSHKTKLPIVPLSEILDLGLNRTDRYKIGVVDDICDSGNTLSQFAELGFTTISIDKKFNSVFTPDYFSYIVLDDDYVVYPWENKEDEPIADYLKNIE